MALTITFDAVSGTNTFAGSASAKTVSHVLGNFSGKIVVAFVVLDTSRTVSAITYNGVAMTPGPSKVEGTRASYLYYLLEASLPVAGTYTLSVTPSGTCNGVIGCLSLYNVKQQAPEATATASSGTDVASWTNNITTLTDGAWAIDACAVWGQRTGTAGASQVERFDTNDGVSIDIFCSTKPVATAIASAMAWTPSSAASYAQSIMAFAPAPEPAGGFFAFF